jgi:hypothetical protein
LVKQFPLFYIEAVAWTADGRYLMAGGRDNQGRLRVYRASDWQLAGDAIVQADASNIEYIAVHGDIHDKDKSRRKGVLPDGIRAPKLWVPLG